ncbi:MAG: PAS domain S-box protein, partial [Ectothiorhodospiraceae bacterium]
MQEKLAQKPAPGNGSGYLRDQSPVLATAAIGIVLSAAIALGLYYRERDSREALFAANAAAWQRALDARLDDQERLLHAVAGFMANTRAISDEAFRGFVTSITDAETTIESVAWHPRVTAGERVAYERTAGPILERDGNGMAGAPDRTAWFPRRYAVPAGADIGLSPTAAGDPRSKTLERTLTNHRQLMTPPLPDGDGARATIYEPVYRPAGTDGQRLLGVVSLTFRADDLLAGVADSIPRADGLAVRVADVTEANRRSPLFSEGTLDSGGPLQRSDVTIGGRRWQLTTTPAADGAAPGSAATGWLAFLLGLVATALLCLERVTRIRRGQAIERQMSASTQALLEANTNLRQHAQEREKTLHALRESEARYRVLADNANDIIARLNRSGAIDYVSPAARSILGFDPHELAGRPIMEFLHEDDVAPTRQRMEQALADHRSFTHSYRMRHRDGHYVSLEAVHRVLESEETGRDVEILSVARDITARMDAERALRESEALFRKVFESAAVGMCFFSIAGARFIRVNHAFAGMLGYSTSELEELSVAGITHPADQHISPSEIQQVLSGAKESFLVEKRYLHKNGSTVWILGNTTLIRHSNGEPRFFISQIQDISDRKRAEQRLAQLSRQQDLILNAAAEGIYGVDMDGFTTFVNRAASEILGFSATELVGRRMHELVHHSHTDGAPHFWENCRVYHSIRDHETHYVDNEVFWHQNGRTVHVQYVSAPIIEQGRATGAVVVFSEVQPAREEPTSQG